MPIVLVQKLYFFMDLCDLFKDGTDRRVQDCVIDVLIRYFEVEGFDVRGFFF